MKISVALALLPIAALACSSDVIDTDLSRDVQATTTDEKGFGNGKAADGTPTTGDDDACTVGTTRACTVDACKVGTQTCAKRGTTELSATQWGPCEGAESTAACTTPPGEPPPATPAPCPDSAPRAADGSCARKLDLNIDGDCVCAPACPPEAPFIVGCKIDFQGSNTNGCVAPAKNGRIYFQEGVKCDSGHLSGFVFCSNVEGAPLDQNNCPINKSDPHFGSKPSKCPDIESGKPDSCYF